MVIFSAVALVHDQHSVRVDDGRKTMSNDHGGAAFETLFQLLLNEIVGFQIHISSCLIQNKNLGFSDDSSGQTQKLFLAQREHGVVF